MTRKYFGTDGVRGRVGDPPITPDWVLKLGYAMGRVLTDAAPPGERPGVLIGKDTRISGYMLEAALESGFSAAGVDVYLSGPLPTPAVAHMTRALRLSAGLVISASHNPFDDNGIKFFSSAGTKLPDEYEQAIEDALERPLVCVPPAELGKARRVADAAGRYVEFCKGTFPDDLDLRGLKLLVDSAHGAGYHVAPPVFHELGAEVVAIGNQPDGININEGFGATVPDTLRKAVVEHAVDVGLALDGDGDRLLMADGSGHVYDGDHLLYVIARHRKERGELKGGVVGTLMSNLGFEQALERLGIEFVRAPVGDRYVLEMMLEKRWQLGGENSGHILCLDKHSTGDAIIAALQVLTVMKRTGKTLAELTADCPLYPQRMINVRMSRRMDWRERPEIVRVKEAVEGALAGSGRVLLRPSGTEPVLRVMVEARDAALAERQAKVLAAAVAESAQAIAAGN